MRPGLCMSVQLRLYVCVCVCFVNGQVFTLKDGLKHFKVSERLWMRICT